MPRTTNSIEVLGNEEFRKVSRDNRGCSKCDSSEVAYRVKDHTIGFKYSTYYCEDCAPDEWVEQLEEELDNK